MRKHGVKALAVVISAMVLATGCTAKKNTEIVPNNGNVQTESKLTETKAGSSIYIITKPDGTVEKTFNNEGELPVDINITYTLDGNTISPEELAGKSGHVTIRFDYVNHAKKTVEIDGVETEVNVPFAMVSGLLVKNSQFTNIEITNGKLVDDGTRTIAIGLAFPGLTDSLMGEKESSEDTEEKELDVKLPEYVEISADVTDFSLDLTMSIATSEVFADFNVDNISTVDELKEKLDEINDAMAKLMDGSVALYEGLDTLYSKVGDLSDGIDELFKGANDLANGANDLANGAANLSNGANEVNNGANSLANGAASLAEGANSLANGAAALNTGANSLAAGAGSLESGAASLEAGAASLANGLSTLTSNNDTLTAASKTVFESLLATATKQLNASGFQVTLTIENYAEVLNTIAASLNADDVYQKALAQVTAAVEANNDAIVAGVTAQVRENVKAQVTVAVLASQGVSEEVFAALPDENPTKQALVAAIEANTDAKMATEEIQAVIAANVAAYKENLINENMQSEAVQSQLGAAATGLVTIQNLKASLDSYNAFYTGLKNYTDGVASASNGANQLYNGSASLSNGASTLSGGAASLAEGANSLSNGANTLAEGANTLSNGASALAQGTKTLADGAVALKDGAAKLADGAKALRDGVKKVQDVMPALKEGVEELKDGAGKLADGLGQFNTEAIEKINEVVNEKLGSFVDRANAVINAAKEYSKNAEGVDSAIKFIFRSEAID